MKTGGGTKTMSMRLVRYLGVLILVCSMAPALAAQPLPTTNDRQNGGAAGQAAPPPTPEHTGLATLVKDTIHDFEAFPQRRSTWAILGIGGAAALAVHPLDTK